jgi:hypothetical protein
LKVKLSNKKTIGSEYLKRGLGKMRGVLVGEFSSIYCCNMSEERFTQLLVQDPGKMATFEQMVDRLSNKTHLDRELLRKYSEQAVGDWEIMEETDVEALDQLSPPAKKEELNKILDYFNVYLGPLIPDRRRINQSIDIALRYFRKMFNCPE